MIEYIKRLTASLCAIPTVSGNEALFENELKELILPLFDECRKTAIGNLVFIKHGKDRGLAPLLIDTHIDQVGLMVTGVCDDGSLRIDALGGLDTRILSGACVTVYGKARINGVITARAPHLMSREEMGKNPKLEHLFIDTGYDSAWLEENAGVGSFVGFNCKTTELLCDRLASHGLDNKCSLVAAMTAVKLLGDKCPERDIALMLSLREELGAAGAVTGGYKLMPASALVLDVNFAYLPDDDTKDSAILRHTAVLGDGPVISFSAATDKTLTRKLIGIAQDNDIPLQTIVEAGSTSTDADRLALVGTGIPVAVLGAAIHNMHTYSEVVSAIDLLSLARLVCAYIERGVDGE